MEQTLKTIRIKIRNKLTERQLFSRLNEILVCTPELEPEFIEVSGKYHTVMGD